MNHYGDVIMRVVASHITSLAIVYSTVYLGADQRKHQTSESLAFVRGINRWPVNSPHKGPVPRKMFPFDDVIMMHDRLDMGINTYIFSCYIQYHNCYQLDTKFVFAPVYTTQWIVVMIQGESYFTRRQWWAIGNDNTNHPQWPLLLTWFNFNPSMDK